MKKTLILIFTVVFLFWGCEKTTDPLPVEELNNAVIVVSEGGFGNGNSSVSTYSIEDKTVQNDVYYTANNSANLGDIGNDLVVVNEKGFIVLGWNEIGFVYNFSKVPILSLEIARSQKWWMWAGDPMSQAMFDAFGITPVPLSFTDVMTSLSTKLIDTASITPYGAVAYRWDTRFKYMNEYPTTNVVGATIVSKRIWNKISPNSQKKILNICQPYFDEISRRSREQDRKSIDVLKKSGIKIVEFDFKKEEDRKRLQFIFDTSRKARESMVGKLYSRQLLDETLSLLAEYRIIHPDSNVVKFK